MINYSWKKQICKTIKKYGLVQLKTKGRPVASARYKRNRICSWPPPLYLDSSIYIRTNPFRTGQVASTYVTRGRKTMKLLTAKDSLLRQDGWTFGVFLEMSLNTPKGANKTKGGPRNGTHACTTAVHYRDTYPQLYKNTQARRDRFFCLPTIKQDMAAETLLGRHVVLYARARLCKHT